MFRKLSRLFFVLSTIILVFIPVSAFSSENLNVWFGPDNDTPDMLDLFRRPEFWNEARSLTNVFLLGPLALENPPPVFLKYNTFQDLKRVGAFAKLHEWGILLASGEGAIKEWDCTGKHAAEVTKRHIANVHQSGGSLDIIGMDEPLLSGLGPCKLSINEAAIRTSVYVRSVRDGQQVRDSGISPVIGDVEPYPTCSIGQLERWIVALKRSGFRPAFFHLDINVGYVDLHREIDLTADLKRLKLFLSNERIPFGILFWSGYDPLNSDSSYYNHTIRLVRLIKAAIGSPDQKILVSWVSRSPAICTNLDLTCQNSFCRSSNKIYCSNHSIPLNIPENVKFTHTRLLIDTVSIFENHFGQ